MLLTCGIRVEPCIFSRWVLPLHTYQQAVKYGHGNAFNAGIDPTIFIRSLDTPERVMLKFTPEMSIRFEGDKMTQSTAQAYADFAAQDAWR